MADDLIYKISAFDERLKISGSEVGRKVTSRMSSVSFKLKEFFHGQSEEEKMIEEATFETLDGPNWSTNLDICDMISSENVNIVEVIRCIKRQIATKNSRVQYLALVLLETCVKNCEKAFSEVVTSERVVDKMVRLIEDPRNALDNRKKAISLIEPANKLRYSPAYQETYKDDLTATLVHQCRRCQFTIHEIIETTSGGSYCESVLSEALN